MSDPAPKIDPRTADDVRREVTALVPFYTKEWTVGEGDSAGNALLAVFAHLAEKVITRLNGVPDKHFIEFLNRLGANLRPPQPAKAHV